MGDACTGAGNGVARVQCAGRRTWHPAQLGDNAVGKLGGMQIGSLAAMTPASSKQTHRSQRWKLWQHVSDGTQVDGTAVSCSKVFDGCLSAPSSGPDQHSQADDCSHGVWRTGSCSMGDACDSTCASTCSPSAQPLPSRHASPAIYSLTRQWHLAAPLMQRPSLARPCAWPACSTPLPGSWSSCCACRGASCRSCSQSASQPPHKLPSAHFLTALYSAGQLSMAVPVLQGWSQN